MHTCIVCFFLYVECTPVNRGQPISSQWRCLAYKFLRATSNNFQQSLLISLHGLPRYQIQQEVSEGHVRGREIEKEKRRRVKREGEEKKGARGELHTYMYIHIHVRRRVRMCSTRTHGDAPSLFNVFTPVASKRQVEIEYQGTVLCGNENANKGEKAIDTRSKERTNNG